MNKLRVEAIRQRRSAIMVEVSAVKRELKARQEAIWAKLTALQERCPHENVVWFNDPAGGSDSTYECADCLKWSRSKFGGV